MKIELNENQAGWLWNNLMKLHEDYEQQALNSFENKDWIALESDAGDLVNLEEVKTLLEQ